MTDVAILHAFGCIVQYMVLLERGLLFFLFTHELPSPLDLALRMCE